jgi:methionyl-tRNA synthetase
MKRRLITSALPYVNNIPHLGNLIQVLSADVFARFCRMRGYETMYVCGTDEYGTATETKALEEGVTPRELCDRFNALHTAIYQWFTISFDKFGRTSTEKQTEIVQDIFLKLDANGYIKEHTIEQLFCEHCNRFLADRYVRGTCPSCGYDGARGDQCENCGKLLEPTELVEPKCSTCGATPKLRSTNHLYIDLPAIKPKLEQWMKRASVEGNWANNAIQMTQAWIRDGLKERGITRDLKWGIPVPKDGFRNKVFYVWFDAPIGYVSITANLTDDWKSWWKNPDEVELFQFIGKDNIPFHTVVFPSSQLGTGEKWTMLHHMSSTEYLNYESGKFSKSKGIGVFGSDAMESGIPADAWRFYIFYNRPEKADALFTWKDFQEKYNGELIGNLGNLVNRTLTFVSRYYEGALPAAEPNPAFWATVKDYEKRIGDLLEQAELREAFRTVFALSSFANKTFQDGEPWKKRNEDPAAAAILIRDLCYVIKDLAILIHPYLPGTADRIAAFFGLKVGPAGLKWDALGSTVGLTAIGTPEILFAQMEDDLVADLRARFSGSQAERKERDEAKLQETKAPEPKPATPPSPPVHEPKPVLTGTELETAFRKAVDLRVAKIVAIEKHPKADKLYIETLEVGTETRTIVSGLVPYYAPEELVGRHIVLVSNLKPAKLRGVMSQGMLLAASSSDGAGGEIVEVLSAPNAATGTRVCLEGDDPAALEPAAEIDVDTFFSMPIAARGGVVFVGEKRLLASGEPFALEKVRDGDVG